MGDPREVNMSSPLLQSRANEECLPLHPGQCMDKVRVVDVLSPPLHLAVAGDRSTIVQVPSEKQQAVCPQLTLGCQQTRNKSSSTFTFFHFLADRCDRPVSTRDLISPCSRVNDDTT